MAVERSFGTLPLRMNVRIDDAYISVKGLVTFGRAQAPLTAVAVATTQYVASPRAWHLNLVNANGGVVASVVGTSRKATEHAARFINDVLAERRSASSVGVRSPDGRYWWDGYQWRPVG